MNVEGHLLAPKGALSLPWLLAAGLALVSAASAHAQLHYLSDSRSVSGIASVSPSIAGNGHILSYSGDYSAVSTPSAPFADFSGHTASGVVSLDYEVNWAGPGAPPAYAHANSSVWVDSSQTSFLHANELSYSSFESGPSRLDFGASAHAASSLLVSFSVSTPVAYQLTCDGVGDPLGSWSSYALSSANLGLLVSGDTGTLLQAQQYGVPILYSGTFEPGDVYTLNLSSTGFMGGGGLVTDLTVAPEPSSLAIAGTGLVLVLCRRKR